MKEKLFKDIPPGAPSGGPSTILGFQQHAKGCNVLIGIGNALLQTCDNDTVIPYIELSPLEAIVFARKVVETAIQAAHGGPKEP